MNNMEAKMAEWRRKMPSKRHLTAQFDKFVQQRSVEVLYSPREQQRIRQMTDMITKATCEFECDEDWDRILKVVDALSNISNRAVLKESIRFLRIRLSDPSPRVVILALTLTESIVKNCGALVHHEIASESFMHQLELLHKAHANKRGRDSMEISERLLEMIQAWGEAFLPYRHQFPLFIETYHNMRKKGVKFPKQYDENRVPVLTPPSMEDAMTTTGPETNTFGGLSTSELYHVAVNVTEMFEDMIHEAQKTTSSISEHGVIVELAAQARELVKRMEGVIQTAVAADDDELGKYLAVNDGLLAALKKFAKVPSRTAADDNQQDHDHAAPASKTEPSNQDDNDDDPFADFVRERATSKLKESAKKPSVPQEEEEEEDDPFASFVQERASKVLAPNSSSSNQLPEDQETKAPAPMKDLIDLWDDDEVPTPALASAVENVAAPIVEKDLWVDDDVIIESTPTSMTTTTEASRNSLIDDIWDVAPAPPAAQPAPASSAPSQPTPTPTPTPTPNPFDLLEDFTTKTSVSTTPSAAPVAVPTAAPANPFDAMLSPAPRTRRLSTNPFDF